MQNQKPWLLLCAFFPMSALCFNLWEPINAGTAEIELRLGLGSTLLDTFEKASLFSSETSFGYGLGDNVSAYLEVVTKTSFLREGNAFELQWGGFVSVLETRYADLDVGVFGRWQHTATHALFFSPFLEFDFSLEKEFKSAGVYIRLQLPVGFPADRGYGVEAHVGAYVCPTQRHQLLMEATFLMAFAKAPPTWESLALGYQFQLAEHFRLISYLHWNRQHVSALFGLISAFQLS